jgi:putative membrane protein
MEPQYFWLSGMWIFPMLFLIVMLIIVYLVFGRGGFRPPWHDSSNYYSKSGGSDTAFEILKKRYAKGEITKEEYEQIKKDLLN